METSLSIKKCCIDADINDFSHDNNEIYIFSDAHDLLVYNERNEDMSDDTCFSLWVNCGKNKDKAIMFEVRMDDLELFAKSLLNHIEIFKSKYSDQIKFQTDKGNNI